jgi:hypothetical protein
MPSFSVIVRLPSGTEYWYAEKTPEVGDTLVRSGKTFVVTACEEAQEERLVVTLEEAPMDAPSLPVSPAV